MESPGINDVAIEIHFHPLGSLRAIVGQSYVDPLSRWNIFERFN